MSRIPRLRIETLRLFSVLLLLLFAANTPAVAQTHSAGLMNFSAAGDVFACSNRDSGTVSIVSWPELKLLREIPVGHKPEGVAWLGKSRRLACCVYGDDEIVILNADTGAVESRISVFDEPYGVVSNADGTRLYATLEYPGQVVVLNPKSGEQLQQWNVGQMLRGICISGDGTRILVTEYLTAMVREISTADGSVKRTWKAASTDNLARQIVMAPGQQRAYVTHIRSRVTAAHGNGSIFPYASVIRLGGPEQGTRLRVPLDTIRGTRVTANPWDCDVAPDGRSLAVAFAGTNDLYVLKIVGDDYVELDFQSSVRCGSNPRAVRFSPDGESFLVYNALDFNVVAYDLRSGQITGTVNVTECPLDDDVLLGKQLFYTALQPMTSRAWISCSSCHPDGDADGRTWQQPEGLRSTQPLAGLAWTHPLHWSADRDEVQDFEHTIRGALMGGRGLLGGRLPDALDETITGRSKALDALAAYTNSHQVPISPHAKNGLTEAALRGRKLFMSAETGCANCHSGPFYSDSQPTAITEFAMHNVGTGNDDDTELMSPAYDTPTLLGLYRSAPYLHHGKAATLHDVLTTMNPADRHGSTSQLNTQQVNDLVEFLKSLPWEDPEKAAESAGLLRVSGRSE